MTGKMERVAPSATSSTSSGGRSTTGSYFTTSATSGLPYGEPNLSLGVADEYNPLCPNDYEELVRQKREKRKTDVSFLTFNFYVYSHTTSLLLRARNH